MCYQVVSADLNSSCFNFAASISRYAIIILCNNFEPWLITAIAGENFCYFDLANIFHCVMNLFIKSKNLNIIQEFIIQ